MVRKLATLIALASLSSALAADAEKDIWVTRSGYYVVSFKSELEPLAINQIHRWVFHVEDSAGNPLDGAVITLTGGMPEHNHGLPTSPKMTAALGNGDYVIEGMRFHMDGLWELAVTVSIDGRRDTVVISITI